MIRLSPDWIGWLATAVFTSSYFSKQPSVLRRIQGIAAALWLSYGLLIHSVPVIVANVIVMVAAFYSSFNSASSARSNRPV